MLLRKFLAASVGDEVVELDFDEILGGLEALVACRAPLLKEHGQGQYGSPGMNRKNLLKT